MLNFNNIKTSLTLAVILCFFGQKIWANNVDVLVEKVGFNQKNQLEIALSKKSDFKVFLLSNPDRLVVDIANGAFAQANQQIVLPDFISSFRSKKSENLRLVFDLTQKISIQKVRFEKISKESSGKITAEIIGVKNVASSAPKKTVKVESELAKTVANTGAVALDPIVGKVAEFDIETKKILNADGSAKYLVKKIPKNLVLQRIPVIVIDSGHGGKDPGTIGTYARTKEKNLTLSYARELGKQLINTKRYKVYLTRDSDSFIPLKKRVEIARRKKADLFISLHANAISDSSVAGFSIYTLSENSSDKQAELLAQKENRADIISGVNFSDASADIMKTLIDLSQRDTMNGSARFANVAIGSIKKSEINILQNTHRFAGFAVLTAPDMISVLIELGYLSSKKEELLLNSLIYKRRVCQSLVEAIDEYFSKNKS